MLKARPAQRHDRRSLGRRQPGRIPLAGPLSCRGCLAPFTLWAAIVSCLVFWQTPARAGDPYLDWYTLVTPHFRVHFHTGLEELAQRTGSLLEAAQEALEPELGWQPDQITQVVLTDSSDSANGSASPLPYNTIRLFATAPDDMSLLADYDDWLDTLVTHEHTHVLHVDNTRGFAAVVNAVFGKSYVPGVFQPRFLTEGLAVTKESEHTTGGRLRSSQFDMYLRMDTLEDNLATLDQMSHPALRWPGGTLWYLYGSKFLEWVVHVYGPGVPRAVADDYAYSVIPFGINRSIRRATGRTYEELYEGWTKHLRAHYAEQRAEVEGRGLRQGQRLTHTGRVLRSPRVAPRCFSKAKSVVFFRDDGHTTPGYYSLELTPDGRTPRGDPELITRTWSNTAAFGRDCDLVFDSLAVDGRGYRFFDLFRQPHGTRAPRGTSRTRIRLTRGVRAREPAVSPSGRRVAYVVNRRGTTHLELAELTPEGQVESVRRLVTSARYEQIYTPSFSPDGRLVAYSGWSKGGFRDIHVVDAVTGTNQRITTDRALDQQPIFSPDGRYLLFSSDRTGISNIYALDRVDGALHQITNVVGGAYMPEVSPDGRLLYYVGYTSEGFDLFVLPLDPESFLEAPPMRVERETPRQKTRDRTWPVGPYEPLPTLRPHSYGFSVGTGSFGTTATLQTSGRDAVGHHAFGADLSYGFGRDVLQGGVGYAYGRLPFSMNLSAFSRARLLSVEVAEEERRVVERHVGVTSGVQYPMPGEFDYQSLAFSYSAQLYHQDLPVGTELDPYARVPIEPHEGLLGLAHVGYFYSNTEGTLYGTGSERGFWIGLGADYASQVTASEDSLYSILLRSAGYVPLPWARHHVLSLGASAGAAGGSFPRRGLFRTGGFVDQGAFDALTSNVFQSAFVLRGYEPAQFSGNRFLLLNAEYRLPVWYADAGLSTLPLYLRQVSAALFVDYGGAFDRIVPDRPLGDFLHAGVGGELWFDMITGYTASTNVRLGFARALDDPQAVRSYFAAAGSF